MRRKSQHMQGLRKVLRYKNNFIFTIDLFILIVLLFFSCYKEKINFTKNTPQNVVTLQTEDSSEQILNSFHNFNHIIPHSNFPQINSSFSALELEEPTTKDWNTGSISRLLSDSIFVYYQGNILNTVLFIRP